MKLEVQHNCPLNNFEPCRQMACAWFVQVRGKNPNTGADIDEWACAVAWLPVLTIEVANQSRQTSASVDSFRNEMVKANEKAAEIPSIPFVPMAHMLRVGKES